MTFGTISMWRISKTVLWAVLVLGGVAKADTVNPSAQTVVRATLGNGLRVVIVRNTLAPVVATAVNYLVGSDEAPEGFPGMAHAQEHMMFRGSEGLSVDQLANIGSMMGGRFNANTRESLTQYTFTVPAGDLDVALHVEADRMQGVLDSEAGWVQERGAIEQEVAQDVSNPLYLLFSKLRATLFKGSPYEHDALGTRDSFDRTTAAMLKKFHDRWYAPNNAILIVVGDVEPKAALAKIEQLFGPLKPKPLPIRPAINLGAFSPTAFQMSTDRPNATQIIAMRMIGLDNADFPALEVLSDILNNHRSELYGLVYDGEAVDAGFSLEPLPHSGMGYAFVSYPPDYSAKKVENDIRAILRRIVQHGVTTELVAAAKRQERSQAEFQKNSITDLAAVWSDAIALYGLSSPDDDLARINRVTKGDVDRVAREYLNLANAVSATMMPQQSGKPVADGGGYGGRESIPLGEPKPVALPAWAEDALGRLSTPASTEHPVVTTLSNGLTLIVQPERVSDTVTLLGHIRNRPEMETPAGKEGLSQLLDEMFDYGSEHLDRQEFQRALDDMGAEEDAGTDFSLKTLSASFDRGAALLAENELHPALPQQAFETVKARAIRTVAARNASPDYLTSRALRTALFPATDPTLREATAKTVQALSLADLREYYALTFRPDLTTIVVIGNISADAARKTIEKYFSQWRSNGPQPVTDLPTAPPNRAVEIVVPNASRVQNTVVLAQTVGLRRADADYYPVALGNAVLGGGFYSARLSNELRKKAGLVYSVDSDIQAGRTRSIFLVQYASDPANVSKASDIVAHQLQDLQSIPVPTDELQRAKALLIRKDLLEESSVDDIARGFVGRRELDLPLDEPFVAAARYIALGPRDVQSAFRRWVRPIDMARVSEGPSPR